MDWHELTKRTRILFVALAILLGASLFIAALTIAKRYGGEEIANVVRDSVEAEKIAQGADGARIVSDHVMVTFRQNIPDGRKKEIAASAGAKFAGPLTDQEDGYLISFRPATWREIRALLDRLQASPDVLSAEPIRIDE